MKTRELYKHKKDDSVIFSMEKPSSEFEEHMRIIAEDNMLITKDGENFFKVIDVESTEGWYEIEDPNFKEEEDLSPQGDLYQEFLATKGIPSV